MLETITFGYSAMKIWPMAAAIANAEATNAQPSLSVVASRCGEDHRDHAEDLGRLRHGAAADHDQRPHHPGEVEEDRDDADRPRRRVGAIADLAGRAQREERRAVEQDSTSSVTPVISP